MIYAEGNNREAVKIKRFSVTVQEITNNSVFDRYYLPELPEINKGRVVGIQTHFPIFLNSNFPWQTVFSAADGNTPPGINATRNTHGLNMTLNLVDNNDILVIENFPMMQLSGYPNFFSAPQEKLQKIMPFDIKINSKKSYIYYFNPSKPITDQTVYVNLTFFYVE